MTDESDSRGKGSFGLIDLFALITIICVLGAFVLMGIVPAREAARKSECSGHLKQIVLGIHNFHDTNNGLPPLTIGPGRASFWVMLQPYCESGGEYNLLLSRTNASGNKDLSFKMQSNWDRLNRTQKVAVSTIGYMTCPSRREGMQMRESGAGRGPLGDYAVVFVQGNPSRSSPGQPDPWYENYDPCNDAHVAKQDGLVRPALLDCDLSGSARWNSWKPRDTFARAAKSGTSNVLIVGEKHLRKRELGACCNKQATDGSYLYADDNWRQFNVARNIRHRFGRGPRDDGAGTDPANGVGFGSYHSAGVQFVRADGSLTKLHRDTDLQIRVYLGLANKDDVTPEFDATAIKKRLEAEQLRSK